MTNADTPMLIANCDLPLSGSAGQRWDVLIESGRISAVTAAGGIGAEARRVIDADGRTLLPGFLDAHVHIPESGVEMLRCDMSACDSRRAVLEQVHSYAVANPNEEWIIGRGWDGSFFHDRLPTLEEIDAVTGARPAYLNNRDGHCVWVNSAALRLAGITERTPDPEGGVIQRDATGGLTGILYESAMQLVSDITPPVDRDTLTRGMIAAQEHMFSLGITGWQDAIVGSFVPTTDVFELYRNASLDGTLKAKVTGSLWWHRSAAERNVAELVELRESLPENGRFRCTSVKIMYDGWFSTQSAAISRDYLIGREGNRGLTFFDPEELVQHVTEIDAAGFDIHFHSVGDRATHEILRALRAAQQKNPSRDRRHQLAHVWLLDDSSIHEMKQLGVIANIQPYWARHYAELDGLIAPSLPEPLRSQQLRFASLHRAGVPLASGSDWPVSSANPLDAVHVAVNRSHPIDGTQPTFFAEESLPLRDALVAATAGSAYALRREDEVGKIEQGKAADLVLLDATLSRTPAAEIAHTKVAVTLVDGEVVYEG